MGCGTSHFYTAKEVQRHLDEKHARLPSAELLPDQTIQLTKKHGFFNASSLLNSTWLRDRLTNDEYRQAIVHVNERLAQSMVGTAKQLPIESVPTYQTLKLALEELNSKYVGRAHFSCATEEDSAKIFLSLQ